MNNAQKMKCMNNARNKYGLFVSPLILFFGLYKKW